METQGKENPAALTAGTTKGEAELNRKDNTMSVVPIHIPTRKEQLIAEHEANCLSTNGAYELIGHLLAERKFHLDRLRDTNAELERLHRAAIFYEQKISDKRAEWELLPIAIRNVWEYETEIWIEERGCSLESLRDIDGEMWPEMFASCVKAAMENGGDVPLELLGQRPLTSLEYEALRDMDNDRRMDEDRDRRAS